MSQTPQGAMKLAARKSGVSLFEYIYKRFTGQKWCMRCRDWHHVLSFGKDSTRYDGFDASCRESRNERARELHVPVPEDLRKPMGPPRHARRDGDKIQARHFVNLSVRTGKIPRPSDIPCFDCGHIGTDRRHEYDHYLGYAAEHHEDVQSVCSRCHCEREMKRGKWGRQQSSGPQQ